tara:strand:- start:6 stop:698 length:693 start_codon:yes stop_codon:yes gene_type:complete
MSVADEREFTLGKRKLKDTIDEGPWAAVSKPEKQQKVHTDVSNNIKRWLAAAKQHAECEHGQIKVLNAVREIGGLVSTYLKKFKNDVTTLKVLICGQLPPVSWYVLGNSHQFPSMKLGSAFEGKLISISRTRAAPLFVVDALEKILDIIEDTPEKSDLVSLGLWCDEHLEIGLLFLDALIMDNPNPNPNPNLNPKPNRGRARGRGRGRGEGRGRGRGSVTANVCTQPLRV